MQPTDPTREPETFQPATPQQAQPPSQSQLPPQPTFQLPDPDLPDPNSYPRSYPSLREWVESIWQQYRTWIITAILVALGIAIFVAWLLGNQGDTDSETASYVPVAAPVITTAPPQSVTVHVTGSVNTPGVYELNTEDRVLDAINLAGGFSATAEQDVINQAQKLVDELYICVPDRLDATQCSTALLFSQGAGIGTSGATQRVNPNTATAPELESLPGIGPVTATQIIRHRQEFGSFSSAQDLLNVSGIGEATLSKFIDLLSFG